MRFHTEFLGGVSSQYCAHMTSLFTVATHLGKARHVLSAQDTELWVTGEKEYQLWRQEVPSLGAGV